MMLKLITFEINVGPPVLIKKMLWQGLCTSSFAVCMKRNVDNHVTVTVARYRHISFRFVWALFLGTERKQQLLSKFCFFLAFTTGTAK